MQRALWVMVVKLSRSEGKSQSREKNGKEQWLVRNLVACHPVGLEGNMYTQKHAQEDVFRTAEAAKAQHSELGTSVLATHRLCPLDQVAYLSDKNGLSSKHLIFPKFIITRIPHMLNYLRLTCIPPLPSY